MTVPSNDELLFLALGGAGEIGMNLNLYGHAGKWLMVDLGIGFGDDSMPGVDVIMPDPAFIEERRDSLIGIVLTHAHEDHLGAVADLWPRLKAPVYATPFAASVLRRKLVEAGLVDTVPVTEIPLGGKFSLPPFELELITMTHSILEPNALAIRTKLGTVFHTGDWKIDPEPLLGEVTDEAMLRRIGDEGALAMVCDSTNVFVDGEAGSEATVRANLEKLVKAGQRPGRHHLLRLQPGAGRERGAGRGGGGPASGAVGAGAAAHGRGGAGVRLSARLPAMHPRAAGGLPAAREGAVHLHRQPGRAARLDGQAGQRRAPRPGAGVRATRRSSPRASSPATSARWDGCTTRFWRAA